MKPKTDINPADILAAYRYANGRIYHKHKLDRQGHIRRTMYADTAIQIYRVVHYQKRTLKAHRVAWVLNKGQWPNGDLDHMNGDKLDNRMENLRETTDRQNQLNRRYTTRRDPTLPTGVRQTNGGRYNASLQLAGKRIYLGTYPTAVYAAVVYDNLKRVIDPDFSATNYPDMNWRRR